MALTYRTVFKNCYYLQNTINPVKWSVRKIYPTRILASGFYHQNTYAHGALIDTKDITFLSESFRRYSTQSGSPPDIPNDEDNKPKSKQGLIQKFKQMYRDYWYVLLPVHVCTSIIWFGGFYYTIRSGFDVLSLLQSLGVSESLIAPLRESTAGYFALTLALYKLVTPLRYTVTVGGTTIAIRKLTAIGWIKPVPSRERIKEIFQEKRDNLQDRFKESKHHYKVQMTEKRTHVMEEMKRYKTEMRNMKNKTPPK